MRSLCCSLLLMGVITPPAQESGVMELQGFLTPEEFREYQRRPDYRHHMDLFRKGLERRRDGLKRQIQQEAWSRAVSLLEEMRFLAIHAARESSQVMDRKDRRSREVKKMEIRLRKLSGTLQDLQFAAPLDYEESFGKTREALEDLRQQLLRQLLEQSAGRRGTPDGARTGARFSRVNLTNPSTGTGGLQDFRSRDRFTEAEYVRIQNSQELYKRVQVFLEIAEARMVEIQRRMQKVEWEKEEENPLEFHTYRDMLHAFREAISGIMINIDEKAVQETAPAKEIEKSLEALYEGISKYLPQLEPIESMAVEIQDRQLYREVQEARDTSLTAQRGALYGLGAPGK